MRDVTVAAVVLWLAMAGVAAAQEQAAGPAPSEEVEPRQIGEAGTIMIGAGGYLDRVYSSERLLPTNYTLHVDISRFLTNRFVARGGLSGSGSYGGEDADERPTGIGAPALHAHAGLLYYLTPQSMWSLYSGAEFWTQLNQRASNDRGSLLGVLGLQGAISSRVGLFLEGGYGLGLTGSAEQTNRLVGRVGLRLRF